MIFLAFGLFLFAGRTYDEIILTGNRSVLDFNPINTIASHLSYWYVILISIFISIFISISCRLLSVYPLLQLGNTSSDSNIVNRADEDVSHFLIGQLLSRHRTVARLRGDAGVGVGEGKGKGSGIGKKNGQR